MCNCTCNTVPYNEMVIDLGLIRQVDNRKDLELLLEKVVMALDATTVKGKYIDGIIKWKWKEK